MSQITNLNPFAAERWENEDGSSAILQPPHLPGPPRYLTDHYQVAGSAFAVFAQALAYARLG